MNLVINPKHQELIQVDASADNLVDLFCGCGGSGGGLLEATSRLGRKVSGTFVNHWDRAIEIHEANHPDHRHLKEDLFLLDPAEVFPAGTQCSLLWASPQCTFFSVARGAACVNEQDRSHAHSVTDWVRHLNPECLMVENVKEFRNWGPVIQGLDETGELIWAYKQRPVYSGMKMARVNGKIRRGEHKKRNKPYEMLPKALWRKRNESDADWTARLVAEGYKPYEVPDKTRKGEYFNAWIAEVEALGYDVDHRLLCSADYGDPTIRTRFFLQAVRKDSGKRIVWPDPTHAEPDDQGRVPDGLQRWRTARDIIDWSVKGRSVFTRDKKLAQNTFRRLAIGLAKYGLRDYLVSSAHHDRELRGLVNGAFITPNFGERPTQTPRTHDVDAPAPTVTSHGAGGIVESEAYILPKDSGWDQKNVRSVDQPASTLTTNHRGEGLVEPSITRTQGQETHAAPPMIDHMRGNGVVKPADTPLRGLTAGGNHQAVAEAFMMAIDQTGGGRNHGTYSADEPVRTIVTKHNAAAIRCELAQVEKVFLDECGKRGVDTERAETFLGFLVDALKKEGHVNAKPWIYVYYSSGSEGKPIDEPLPSTRTKAGHALVYPVIELDGDYILIDLLYRMLMPIELQRAMGFPDDMAWGTANQTEQVKAIGNSVSHGVSCALGLAFYSQQRDIRPHLYETEKTKTQNTSTN